MVVVAARRLDDFVVKVACSLDASATGGEAAEGAAVFAAEAATLGHVVIVAAKSVVAHFQSPLEGYDC